MSIKYTDEEIHDLGAEVMRLAKSYRLNVGEAIHSVADGDHNLATAIGKHLAALANEARRKRREQREREALEQEIKLQAEINKELALLAYEERVREIENHERDLIEGFIIAGHEDDI